jgi:hypothetical protein
MVQETTSQKGILLNNLQASFHSLALGIHVNKTTPNRGEKWNNPISMIQSCGPRQTIIQSGCKSNVFEGAGIMVSLTSIQYARARRILEECSTKCNSRNIVNDLLAKP